MKIAYNPKTAAALTTAPANDDITFDLSGLSIYVKGVRFKGTDTTYSVFKKHGSSGGGYDGLVPVPNYNNDSKNRYLREDGTWVIPTDTRNTAGSTNSTSKLFLIGATSQAANPQTYSNSSIYTTTGTLYATAFVGSLLGNAETTTKLQTARTIWGQSFDGTANVSGSLIQVTDITMGGHINMTNSQPSIKRNNENIIRIADAGLVITPYTTDGFIALRCGTKTDTSGTKELRILNNGNVGIGITSPSQKLHVDGNILATGIMTAAHFYESSDILLKENISSILGTDNIPILRKFNWKKDGKVGYGFIAQELEEQGYYELVNGNEDGTKTVHYTAALSLVVAKLQNKIKELEKKIEILKCKN